MLIELYILNLPSTINYIDTTCGIPEALEHELLSPPNWRTLSGSWKSWMGPFVRISCNCFLRWWKSFCSFRNIDKRQNNESARCLYHHKCSVCIRFSIRSVSVSLIILPLPRPVTHPIIFVWCGPNLNLWWGQKFLMASLLMIFYVLILCQIVEWWEFTSWIQWILQLGPNTQERNRLKY